MLLSISPIHMYCTTPTMTTASTIPMTRPTQAGFPSSVSAIDRLLLLPRGGGRGGRRRRSGGACRARGTGRAGRPRRRLRLVREVERHVECVDHRRDADLRHGSEVRLLEQRIVLDVVDEVRDGVRIESPSAHADVVAADRHVIEPDEVRQIARDLIHHADRSLLVLLELVDQIDALLKRFLLALKLFDLRDDLLQAVGFGLLARHDVAAFLELAGLVPPPSAGNEAAEDDAAHDEQVVEGARGRCPRHRGRSRERTCAPYRPPFPHQIDLNQASHSFRMANPTAMAMLGPISASSSGLNSFSSTLIFWKGFMMATGMPNLSRRIASRFSTPEPPPARTISSTSSAPGGSGRA